MSARILIPDGLAAGVLFDADRTCCICNERGRPVQIHHIDDDPANNTPINLAVLCLICHRDTQVTGGFDRKLDAHQLRLYRDDWLMRVRQRRSAVPSASTPARAPAVSIPEPSQRSRYSSMLNYINTLPHQRRAAYAQAQIGWDSGVTAEMMNASYGLIHGLQTYLVGLAQYYPKLHFDGAPPDEFFATMTQARFTWHRAHLEPDGVGHHGTVVGPLAAGAVTRDLERMVLDMVNSLTSDEPDFNFAAWKRDWLNA